MSAPAWHDSRLITLMTDFLASMPVAYARAFDARKSVIRVISRESCHAGALIAFSLLFPTTFDVRRAASGAPPKVAMAAGASDRDARW